MKKEIWKDIEGYENLYKISNHGRIKSLKRKRIGEGVRNYKVNEKILKKRIDSGGYLRIALYKNSKAKHLSIHRLVAKHFVENPEGKPEVNHIDEDKSNNYFKNLEWSTRLENIRHGTGIQRSAKSRSKKL